MTPDNPLEVLRESLNLYDEGRAFPARVGTYTISSSEPAALCALRIARFIADPASVEVVARAMKSRRFERTGHASLIAEMDAPTENELDDALAILTFIAERGMGE